MEKKRGNFVYEVIEEKQLTEADRKAGVISDQIVKIGASKADDTPDHTVRLVMDSRVLSRLWAVLVQRKSRKLVKRIAEK